MAQGRQEVDPISPDAVGVDCEVRIEFSMNSFSLTISIGSICCRGMELGFEVGEDGFGDG